MVRFSFAALTIVTLLVNSSIAVQAEPLHYEDLSSSPSSSSVEECGTKTNNFKDYRGTTSTTVSGRTCAAWDDDGPHSHRYKSTRYPKDGMDGNNYCRNPSNSDHAWCYTTDPDKRWEYCAVPDCDSNHNVECGLKSSQQKEYRGTIDTTWSGLTCANWDEDGHHSHRYKSSRYPNEGLIGNNYCRNPSDGDRAWCYTTDPEVRWQYCNVPLCSPDPDDTTLPTNSTCGTTWWSGDDDDNEEESSSSLFVGQSDYRGFVSKTVSGRTCQNWNDQAPHKHSRTFQNYPFAGLESNYCRNPDGERQAWCYTTDPNKRWEYCDVPSCDSSAKASLCYDYSSLKGTALGPKECTASNVIKLIKDEYNRQDDESDKECVGGIDREVMALTGTNNYDDAHRALTTMCGEALKQASDNTGEPVGWEMLETKGQVDLEEYFNGGGFLNDETGNFQQEANDFLKRGGKENYIYIGDDPRLNDYLSTTEQSYQAGQEIYHTYQNEASTHFLSSPTSYFGDGASSTCPGTNSVMCCWHRDRQYFDNNGNCNSLGCANRDPGDNTDLCWTTSEDGTEVFPYPGDDTENDLHCHGFAFNNDNIDDDNDINSKARWNNLFYVSMYDHLYQRGYVDSITDDPNIAGSVQPMCGCVEDMHPVARADCTEILGRTNYTLDLMITEENNSEEYDATPHPSLLAIKPVPDTFKLEFRACQGYDYVEGLEPANYDPNELTASNNDLSAFVFRMYLEGKMDTDHVDRFEQTVVGYRDPSVNDGDDEREAACKSAFERIFPDLEWIERKNVPTTVIE